MPILTSFPKKMYTGIYMVLYENNLRKHTYSKNSIESIVLNEQMKEI